MRGLKEKLVPLSTRYSQSGDDKSGTTEKDVDELSDEGQKTRDSGKNDK